MQLSSRSFRLPAGDIRRRLFGTPHCGGEALAGSTRFVPAMGWAAWLMPVGAAAVALLGWVATPGFPLQAVAGDTNAALRSDYPRFLAGSVNCIPAGRLPPVTSTLSNVAPSTNVPVHGLN